AASRSGLAAPRALRLSDAGNLEEDRGALSRSARGATSYGPRRMAREGVRRRRGPEAGGAVASRERPRRGHARARRTDRRRGAPGPRREDDEDRTHARGPAPSPERD